MSMRAAMLLLAVAILAPGCGSGSRPGVAAADDTASTAAARAAPSRSGSAGSIATPSGWAAFRLPSMIVDRLPGRFDVSRDGRRFLYSHDGRLSVYDPVQRSLERIADHPVEHWAMSPDGRRLLVASGEHVPVVYELHDLENHRVLTQWRGGHDGCPGLFGFTGGFVCDMEDRAVLLEGDRLVERRITLPIHRSLFATVSTDGRLLAMVLDGEALVHDLRSGRTVLRLSLPECRQRSELQSIAFDDRATRLAVGTACGDVRVWSLPAGTILADHDEAHGESGTRALAFLPDGSIVAHRARLELLSSSGRGVLGDDHELSPSRLAVRADGSVILTGEGIRGYDARGEPWLELERAPMCGWAQIFFGEAPEIVVECGATIERWDGATGRLLERMRADHRTAILLRSPRSEPTEASTSALEPGEAVREVSPAGDRFLASRVGATRLIELSSGREIVRLAGSAFVYAQSSRHFTADGRHLVVREPELGVVVRSTLDGSMVRVLVPAADAEDVYETTVAAPDHAVLRRGDRTLDVLGVESGRTVATYDVGPSRHIDDDWIVRGDGRELAVLVTESAGRDAAGIVRYRVLVARLSLPDLRLVAEHPIGFGDRLAYVPNGTQLLVYAPGGLATIDLGASRPQ